MNNLNWYFVHPMQKSDMSNKFINIQEEALKVEMAMQKLAIEQVKQERLEGEQRLKKAVQETEERCQKELEAAVAKARTEEKQIAKTAAEKATKYV